MSNPNATVTISMNAALLARLKRDAVEQKRSLSKQLELLAERAIAAEPLMGKLLDTATPAPLVNAKPASLAVMRKNTLTTH